MIIKSRLAIARIMLRMMRRVDQFDLEPTNTFPRISALLSPPQQYPTLQRRIASQNDKAVMQILALEACVDDVKVFALCRAIIVPVPRGQR